MTTPAAQSTPDHSTADRPELWVFGYGSLMWKPGFEYAEKRCAHLYDYQRSFCLWSISYRGTPERPGLVLGLDAKAGALTRGVAFRVAPEKQSTVRDYLFRREMITAAYHETFLPVRLLEQGRETDQEVEALCYVVRHDHPQYAGNLSVAEQARIISACCGQMGSNCEYLFETAAHLRAVGVHDPIIEELIAQVLRLRETQTTT